MLSIILSHTKVRTANRGSGDRNQYECTARKNIPPAQMSFWETVQIQAIKITLPTLSTETLGLPWQSSRKMRQDTLLFSL